MNKRFVLAAVALLSLPVLAHASCDDAKSGIDAKLKAKGLSGYSLDVVSSDQADSNGGKVVGNCEGDKKIVYTRGGGDASGGGDAPAPAASSDASPRPMHRHRKPKDPTAASSSEAPAQPAPAGSSGG